MPDHQDLLLNAVLEIRELIRLMAEPDIAQRDEKHRAALRLLAGKSPAKQKAVVLMDGSRSQVEIRQQVKIDSGDLSKLVKGLKNAGLLADGDKPKLVISLPSNFFQLPEAQ